jgi:GH15 family glucan-1,4-alpha-glucosidase
VPRIEDYALIGDLETAALVSRVGSVDWCCFPRFDSGACFAALVGERDHGYWRLAPATEVRRSARRYRTDTLILESIYETDAGTVRAIDFMPPRDETPDIVRIVEGLDGSVPMRSELAIRFDYGHIVPWVHQVEQARVAVAGPDALCLRTPVEVHGEGLTTVSEFTLRQGDRVPLTLTWFPSHQQVPEAVDAERALRATEAYWHEWAAACDGRVSRRDPPVAARIEGDDVCADGRNRRRSHDVVAGAAWWRAQLGLPVLLAS